MIVLETLGHKLADAGLNSLVCIAVVFCVLIFISLVISLFRFIPKAEQKIAMKKQAKKADSAIASEAVDNTVSRLEIREEELILADELELVAVISSAIAAASGASEDSFVVRSIKKIRR
ncbi:MAG: OadG family protein [Butyrivibrio sp.]|nr:OadG family protein [Butyrivibrio sp.]